MWKHIAIAVACLSGSAYAAITVESVTGASAVDKSGSSVVIYGGIAGSLVGDCASPSNSSTCNNCNTGSLLACNENRIHPNLEMEITIKSTTAKGKLKMFSGSTEVAVGNGGTSTAVNQSTSIKVDWSEICGRGAGSDTTCATNESSAITLTIGFDTEPDGDLDDSTSISFRVNAPSGTVDTVEFCDSTAEEAICDYEIYPGDKKVFMLEPQSDDSDFPNTSYGLTISGIRVFMSETSFASANPKDADFIADLDLIEDSESFFVNDRTITGLNNNTYYFSRVGVTDPAGNVSFITSNTAIDSACGSGASGLTSSTVTTTDDTNCTYIARPDTVVGLLSDDFNCFIATAAYGTAWFPKVVDLRNFRDKFLKSNGAGRWFVKTYYHYSPRLAQMIRRNPQTQPFVRILLWPAWAFAYVSLEWGLLWSITVFLATLLLFGFALSPPVRKSFRTILGPKN